MCRNGDPFWPGAFVNGQLDTTLLIGHFCEEKFRRKLTLAEIGAVKLLLDGQPFDEPTMHRLLAEHLGEELRPAECECGGAA